MKLIIRLIFLCLLFPSELFSKGNTVDRPDSSPKGKIMQDIQYLCMDSLKGRLTGSDGEQMAARYIQSRFESLGLKPFNGRYDWDFSIRNGQVLSHKAYVKICNKPLNIGSDIVFMPYATTNEFSGYCMPNVDEDHNVWLVPFSRLFAQKTTTPHKVVYDYARLAAQGGCKALVLFNDMAPLNDLPLLTQHKFEALDMPVTVLNYHAFEHYIKPNLRKDWILVESKLDFEETNTVGKNVMGFLDNKMPLTMVVCANYDHIGDIPGADNNASGVAGLFYLAEQIITAKLANYNYLFIAFSGKEQNLQGSTQFLKQNENILNTFSSVVNLDMIGRFRTATREVFVSGVGTSPMWTDVLNKVSLGYQFQTDSSGYGYSDLTSFYLKQIPGLRISTGYHSDFQSEGDTPMKISVAGEVEVLNLVFKMITEMSMMSRPFFTSTTDYVSKMKSARVDMGFLPDLTYMGDGVMVGACIRNKIAGRAGLMAGDIIIKIGEYDVVDYDDYVKAIRKSSDERETVVVVRRAGAEYKFYVLLN